MQVLKTLVLLALAVFSELIEQEKICGTDGLVNLIEKRWKGLLKLRQLLGDDSIDYTPLGGYELFRENEVDLTEQCVSKIEHFNKLIATIVGLNAFCLKNESINAFGLMGIKNLIANQYEAQIDTGKMMFNLLLYAQQIGISVFNNCKVDEIIAEDFAVLLKTKEGDF